MFPNISIEKFKVERKDDTDGSVRLVLLLKVQNPTLGLIRIRFGSKTPYTLKATKLLKNLLLNPYKREYVDASVIISSNENDFLCKLTDTVELQASEDILLELGRQQDKTALSEVEKWDPSSTLNSSKLENMIRIVANHKDSAWFEIVLNDVHTVNQSQPDNFIVTMPIGIQIQVGNNSWESSLIKPLDENTEDDFVQFWTRIVVDARN